MTDPVPSGLETNAASITLAALEEMCPPRNTAPRPLWYELWYQLAPSPELLFEDQVVSRLGELPKPLACFGYSIGGGFVLCAWPLPAKYRRHMMRLRELAEGIRADLAADDKDRLLIRTASRVLHVSADLLDAWFAQYFLPHLQMSFGNSDDGGMGDGKHLLRFSPPTRGSSVELS